MDYIGFINKVENSSNTRYKVIRTENFCKCSNCMMGIIHGTKCLTINDKVLCGICSELLLDLYNNRRLINMMDLANKDDLKSEFSELSKLGI